MSMDVKKIGFKGYDARPLRSVVMRETRGAGSVAGVARELAQIGKQEGFDVFVQTPTKLIKENYDILSDKTIQKFPNESRWCWTQDNLTFTPQGYVMASGVHDVNNAMLVYDFKKPLKFRPYHLAGGNFFFIREGEENSLLIGENALKYIMPQTLKNDYGVKNIYPISQPDFHIDLGVRPLNGRNILVNDDEMTLDILSQVISKAKKYISSNKSSSLSGVQNAIEEVMKMFSQGRSKLLKYAGFNQLQRELTDYGFNVIRVPGRIVYKDPNHLSTTHYLLNYMNAIVHERKDGSLVYMTNKSYLDDLVMLSKANEQLLDFNFERMFTDVVKDYIAPKDVHFIEGDCYLQRTLENSEGGLHCLCAEEPVLPKVSFII